MSRKMCIFAKNNHATIMKNRILLLFALAAAVACSKPQAQPFSVISPKACSR